jgi:hypothetical protein
MNKEREQYIADFNRRNSYFKELKERREEKLPCISIANETSSPTDNKGKRQIDIPECDILCDKLLSATKIGSTKSRGISRASSFDSVITETNTDKQIDSNLIPIKNNMKDKFDKTPIEIIDIKQSKLLTEGKNEHLQFNNENENKNNVKNDKNETPVPMRKKSLRFNSNEETDNFKQKNIKSQRPESSIGAFPLNSHSEYSNRKNRDEEFFNFQNFSLKKYLCTEMLGIGESGHLLPEAVGILNLSVSLCNCIYLLHTIYQCWIQYLFAYMHVCMFLYIDIDI